METIEYKNTQEIMDSHCIKPFLKWAGGKFRVLEKIKKYIPKNYRRFIEPFVGAGSVFLNIDCQNIIVSDINSDLINTWQSLKDSKLKFIKDCKELFSYNNNKKKFNLLKEEFNQTENPYRKSLLFIYLNRHCFNGLCRYNSNGAYNVPFGKYDNPYFPEEELISCMNKIQNVSFCNKDFREIINMAKEDDVIYCDPPYFPISETANFDNYYFNGFSLKDHIDLARLAHDASERGATIIITNHYNWYSKELYKEMYNAKIHKILVSRTINSKIDNRKSVNEIIAVFNNKI